MLKLRQKKPEFVAVPLGGGSVLRVRPATQLEVETASAQTSRDLAGLIDGAEIAERLAKILGEDFQIDGLKDRAKLLAASQKLSRIHLVMACHDGWRNVALDDGTVLDAPEPWSVALLLNDPEICYAVVAVINARVHAEDAEGNVSPALPNGGAGTLDGAPNVGPAANSVPTGSASASRTLN